MPEVNGKPYTREDLLRAYDLIEKNHQELFQRLVKSELENMAELREGGIPLIIALREEGFIYDTIGMIDMAAEFRELIWERFPC